MKIQSSHIEPLFAKLNAYKRKYYTNILIRGVLFFTGMVFSTWLVFSSVEYFGRFNSSIRLTLLASFIGLAIFALVRWVISPILKLTNLNRQLSDEEAALQIGEHFPEVKDKLVNVLQLNNLTSQQNELVVASIQQKSSSLRVIPFSDAINLTENRKHLKFVVVPLVATIAAFLIVPQMLSEGTNRIIHYNASFAPKAPFAFVLDSELKAFRNDDVTLNLTLEGNIIPDQVYVLTNGKRNKMKMEGDGKFSFVFKSIQHDEQFTFESGGFESAPYLINVFNKPELRYFETYVEYPAYLKKKNESIRNAGNITIPEGSTLNWEFGTADAEILAVRFLSTGSVQQLKSENNLFNFRKTIFNAEDYELELVNKQSKETLLYKVNVIKDQFPTIQMERFNDTVLYSRVSLGGKIEDDYGINSLKLFYRVKAKENESAFRSIVIPFDRQSPAQHFYYNWQIDTIKIDPGHILEYFVQVWDNDAVNGNKSAKSLMYEFKLPTAEQANKEIKEASAHAQNKMESLLSKTLELQEDINKLQQKLRNEKSLSWQDKRDLENVLKKHESLQKEMEQLNKSNQQLNEKLDKFSPQEEETATKMLQLQKLFDELLDEDTKKMYEELQKMLQDKASKEIIEEALKKMNEKDEALNQELDRALELFKQLKFEQKANELIDKLEKLSEKQDKLGDQTQNKEMTNDKLTEEQQKLNEEFKTLQEGMKELEEINKTLENKKDMESSMEQEQEVEKSQSDSKKELENNQNSKASKSQKNAAKKMGEMADKLSKMQSSNAMEQAEENLKDLRAILENLLTLSFDQEELMKDFKKVSQSDPRYVQLAQKQLKLKDDSKIIEDSLLSLAKRVFQIQAFVTRELRLMKGYMHESSDWIKARRPDMAAGKQQFAMTSMNNLALMLNDVLKQMQQAMAEAKNAKGNGMCKKPGKNQNPGLGELQKQLNQSIEQLKKGGQTGRQLSEELAKLAAQQEMIRKALKEMEGKMGKDGKTPGNQLSEMKKMMEETEKDLVNKKVTQETIMRQREILTKLLESEKAMRERELDEKREAEQVKELKNEIPPNFEKYLKSKEKQIDLIKTVPPSLNEYYKQEVDEYFQKLEN